MIENLSYSKAGLGRFPEAMFPFTGSRPWLLSLPWKPGIYILLQSLNSDRFLHTFEIKSEVVYPILTAPGQGEAWLCSSQCPPWARPYPTPSQACCFWSPSADLTGFNWSHQGTKTLFNKLKLSTLCERLFLKSVGNGIKKLILLLNFLFKIDFLEEE